jgi:hypothetical protein
MGMKLAKLGWLSLIMGGVACGGTVDVFGEGGSDGAGGDEPIVIGGGPNGGTTSVGGAPSSSGSGGSSNSGGASTGGASTTNGSSSATGSSSTGSSVTSTGSGTLTCDGTGVCDSCQSCAWSGPCQGYANACLANADCVAIIQCYQQCTADDCTTPCWIPYPNGHADYLAASICVTCDNCYADCNGSQVGCPENP